MSKNYFEEVDQKVNFPSLEVKVLSSWEENDVFKKSLDKNKDGKPFVFYEGPPTANGKPGIHHVEARSFKDIVPRYKTMRGFYCERKAGWDCHGLPVELEVEKKLGISGKPQIEDYGIEEFNALCKKSVFEYVEEWEKLTKRMGYWIDLKNPYETMDNAFIESEWQILKQIWEKGWLYEDYKVVPYCPRCGTPLSSHELALGYKDVDEVSNVYKYKVKDQDNTYLLAWSTTPWNKLATPALAVNPKLIYAKVKQKSEFYILAIDTLNMLKGEYGVIEKIKGKDLIGIEFEPHYNFYKIDLGMKAFVVVGGDFVGANEGTGIVTIAAYGEDDLNLIRKEKIQIVLHVDEGGMITKDSPIGGGMYYLKSNKLVNEDLKKKGLVYRQDLITHSVGHCWRCSTILMYYPMTSWYLKTTAVKDQLIANNTSVNWLPDHIKKGRMGEWLENNRDWALSRSRYWGTPLPIWKCSDCEEIKLIGSIKELADLAGRDLSELDLHKPFIDEIKFNCEKCKGEMQRVSFVLDCWFDSGAMPYAQWHYPFENEEKFKNNFPADYIAEAIDQTRGWFYTLQGVSALLENGSAYKNVICLGHVLDEKGNKMSKSKGNIVNPWEVMNEVGADATRWYFYSVISPGPSFRFSINLVKDVTKRFMLILWNSYNFFVTYANLNGWEPGKEDLTDMKLSILDEWILARLQETVNKVSEKMDNYDLFTASHDIEDFVSKDFSQWYIRRSRKELSNALFATTYKVLTTVACLMAPFAPFISDEIYKNLTKEESVHLASWPEIKELTNEEEALIKEMVEVRQIVEKGHALRKEVGIPVRQPLAKIIVSNASSTLGDYLYILSDELNIKHGQVSAGSGELKVELDTNITPELKAEGEARNIVRKIQEERKTLGTNLDELVIVTIPSWPKEHEDYIKKNALVSSISEGEFKVERLS